MLPPFVRNYLLKALGGTADVLEGLLLPLAVDDPRWDFRPDPERFTLREIIAHLADWNPIFLERMIRACQEQDPALFSIDEGRLAIDRDYAHSDPKENLRRFRAGRQAMIQQLSGWTPDEWQRVSRYLRDAEDAGTAITIEQWAIQTLSHDGYHTQQVSEWLAKSAKEGSPGEP